MVRDEVSRRVRRTRRALRAFLPGSTAGRVLFGMLLLLGIFLRTLFPFVVLPVALVAAGVPAVPLPRPAAFFADRAWTAAELAGRRLHATVEVADVQRRWALLFPLRPQELGRETTVSLAFFFRPDGLIDVHGGTAGRLIARTSAQRSFSSARLGIALLPADPSPAQVRLRSLDLETIPLPP